MDTENKYNKILEQARIRQKRYYEKNKEKILDKRRNMRKQEKDSLEEINMEKKPVYTITIEIERDYENSWDDLRTSFMGCRL